MKPAFYLLLSLCLVLSGYSQGSYFKNTVQLKAKAPINWSVTLDKNIAWRLTLPETGQSTVITWEDKLFFTCLKPVEEDATLGRDIIAYCVNAENGEVLWTREIIGNYPLKISSPFGDSSAPPAITNGKMVCFFNASGKIVCFNMNGDKVWEKDIMIGRRTLPYFIGDQLIINRQNYFPEPNGVIYNKNGEYNDTKYWGQVQALDFSSGKVLWTSRSGVFHGCISLPTYHKQKPVVVLGRGGGHNPPEKPFGLSLVDGKSGETLWDLELQGYSSNQSNKLFQNYVVAFKDGHHLWIDAQTGKVIHSLDLQVGTVYAWENGAYKKLEKQKIDMSGSSEGIMFESNLVVGHYHYFRTYKHYYLGRVNLISREIEYLELPAQIRNHPSLSKSDYLWGDKKFSNTKAFKENDMLNSRGIKVMGDKRSKLNGWGHAASALPSALGDHLYIPTMSGVVYVIKWNNPRLNPDSIVAINDLGPIGETFNRASLSSSNGKLYAHTIKEIICIK